MKATNRASYKVLAFHLGFFILVWVVGGWRGGLIYSAAQGAIVFYKEIVKR